MAGKISMGARREVLSAVTERYRSAKRAEKGRILDELCATTAWHRKHAVRALRRRATIGPGAVEAPRGCGNHAIVLFSSVSEIGRCVFCHPPSQRWE
ncbi:hypothetical protein ABIB00_005991 [Bradyrhizobium sp. LB14.3]|uniref:hypothetical protein n=1 Tax=Bradyrhizobium sp. LB14.3 TaxID=3156328 RepID=UPI00339796E1